MATYVYDKRIGKVVQKRSRDDRIELFPMPEPPQWWNAYLEMMDDFYAVMSSRQPRGLHHADGQQGETK
jgi:hypothetical protein